MAASNWTFYNTALTKILDGTLDFDTQNFKVALLTADYTPTVATDALFSAIDGDEVVNDGYTAGGAAVTMALTGTSTKTLASTADPSWTATTTDLVAKYAVLYETGGSHLVAYSDLDSGGTSITTTTGNTLTLTGPSTAIFTMTTA